MKKILVTGSHGYIGTRVCPELQKLGYSIRGIDNGYFIDCLLKDSINDLPFTKKHIDKIVLDDLKNIDVVIHLAGLQNDPLKTTFPGEVYDIEYQYTRKLAKVCKKFEIQFIYASSCSIYGAGSIELLNEESQTNPITAYSKNKLRIENYLLSISDSSFNPIMLRFATVFGYSLRMRFDLYINMFTGMALAEKKIQLNSDGTAWRPNLYIGDISGILNSILEYNFSEPTIINVGNPDSNMRVADVVKIIKNIDGNVLTSLLKQENSLLYGDQYVSNNKDKRSYKVDFSKMIRFFGKDTCSTDVKKGIETLISDLKILNDLKGIINNSNFFRLQWTQKLIKDKIINRRFEYKK